MNLSEYLDKVAEIKAASQKKIYELQLQYALEHNPYQIGDIVTDHIGSILVETISAYTDARYKEPQAMYEGRVLKKDGTPTKKEQYRVVWQMNLIKGVK